jgi:hypothetical protein
VADLEYWVVLTRGSDLLGAGVLLTRRYVLTAAHCLLGVDACGDVLNARLSNGEWFEARVREKSNDADLGLLEIPSHRSVPFRLPGAVPAKAGESWQSTYEPAENDPHLSGDVASPARRFKCAGGATITALQLNCGQILGDYAGYSGSPVERQAPIPSRALFGVLLEQYPDRQATRRSSNVLFAATIQDAMQRFEALRDIEGILDEMQSGAEAAARSESADRRQRIQRDLTEMDASFAGIDSWRIEGRMSPLEVAEWKVRALDGIVDKWLRPPDDEG